MVATRIKHDVKSQLTVSANAHGGSDTASGSTTRTHVQVLCNSVFASGLMLAHWWFTMGTGNGGDQERRFEIGKRWEDALMVGVMTHYAAVTSDTLSSELGILSKSPPRLIYTLQTVPPGTNGGVSLTGLLSGISGSAIIGLLCIICTPFAPSYDTVNFKVLLVTVITIAGTIGTLLDSFLGATLQASVVDVKHGKIVESDGGEKVLVGHESNSSRKVLIGNDILSNNMVNLSMAGAMAAAGVGWGYQYHLEHAI